MRIEKKDHSKTTDPTVIMEETDPETLTDTEVMDIETHPGVTGILIGDLTEMIPVEIKDSQKEERETATENRRDTTTTERVVEAQTETDRKAGTESTLQQGVHQMR